MSATQKLTTGILIILTIILLVGALFVGFQLQQPEDSSNNTPGNNQTNQCSIDEDCSPNDYCAGGTCVAKIGNGNSCTAGNECQSGNCSDEGLCTGISTDGNSNNSMNPGGDEMMDGANDSNEDSETPVDNSDGVDNPDMNNSNNIIETDDVFVLENSTCVELRPEFSGEIPSMMNSIATYTASFTTSDPTEIENLILRVDNDLGRSKNDKQSSLVRAQNINYNNETQVYTALFEWEALGVDGVTVQDGTYDVNLFAAGKGLIDVENCQSTVNINSSSDLEPNFISILTASQTCTDTSEVYSFNFEITNNGLAKATPNIGQINLDTEFSSQTQVSEISNGGNLQNNQIVWNEMMLGEFEASQTKVFSYLVTINLNNISSEQQDSGFVSTASILFDTSSSQNNVFTFDLNTSLTCPINTSNNITDGVNEIPSTSIGDFDLRFIIIGFLMLNLAMITYLVNPFDVILNKYFEPRRKNRNKGYESEVQDIFR